MLGAFTGSSGRNGEGTDRGAVILIDRTTPPVRDMLYRGLNGMPPIFLVIRSAVRMSRSRMFSTEAGSSPLEYGMLKAAAQDPVLSNTAAAVA